MPASKSIVHLEDAFAYHINRVHRLLRQHFQMLTRRLGQEITQEQYFILNKLYHRPDQSQNDLAADLGDRANTSRALAVLEKTGTLSRTRDTEDKRRVIVNLTRAGRELVERLNPVFLGEREVVYAGLSQKDLKELRRIFGILETNLKSDD